MKRLKRRIKNLLLNWIDERGIRHFIKKHKADYIFRIHTYTSKRELIRLFFLTLSLPRSSKCLEIGSYLGASSCFIAMALAEKDGLLYCVDTWDNETMPEGKRNTFSEFLKNTERFKNLILPIHKSSQDLNEDDINSARFNLIFIDGDHSYEVVKRDFQFASEHLVEDGIIVLHDFRWFIGVSRILGEALSSGLWRIMGTEENLCWITKIKN